MYLLQPQPQVNTSSLVASQSMPCASTLSMPNNATTWSSRQTEVEQVDWLILHFNHWFSHHNVILVRGDFEPEYFPSTAEQPARIQFAHGFFNSALHEISHWSIAGEKRRLLPDLGYWYAPDGRNAEQQALFEQVEIKPQAIEWLYAMAFGRKFRVSLDNLTGEGSDGAQFKDNVYAQVLKYFNGETKLPRDAAHLIQCICMATRQGKMLKLHEFSRAALD